jgi:hypothetical protein
MLIVIPLLVMAIGAGLLWLAARLRRGERVSPSARRAVGTVVALRRRGEPASAFPVVRFELPDGSTVEAQGTWGSRPARHREGDRLEILYDPRDPTRIHLAGESASGAFLAVALAVAGAGFLALGVLLALGSYALHHLS